MRPRADCNFPAKLKLVNPRVGLAENERSDLIALVPYKRAI